MSRPARRAGGGPGDADLLFRVRAGDRDAFDGLVDRLGRPALALARCVLGDDAAADDVLRAVFLDLWRDPAAYDRDSGSVAARVLEQVHRRAVEAVRRGQVHRSRTGGRPAAGDPAGADAAPGAADPVRAALRGLPDAERAALTLAYYDGYTQREVAALTGTPLGEVKAAALAAVRALRGELGAVPQGGALGSPAVAERPAR
ncbi:sigma factor-like helix-turn-helix DNA-binding protein [Geodermatophilus sp. SYSU D00079]